MIKLTAKQATEKAICKVCTKRFGCNYNEYEVQGLKAPFCGCALRGVIIKEWMDDMMGFDP